MSKIQTKKINYSDLLSGDMLYLERARITLPYLVRQAKAGQKIFYSDLASEIQIPNVRNLNKVLGAIGNALITLGKKTNSIIPPIQCLVVNKKTGLPGKGIGVFISKTAFDKLTRYQKEALINRHLMDIFAFDKWDWVLAQLEIKPVKTNFKKLLKRARGLGYGGESEHHKKFKILISKNPRLLNLNISTGIIEYKLPSTDSIDVLFKDKEQFIGVEVKSSISETADILRGLFQCVKYRYLLEAEQAVNSIPPNCRIILALQGQFPEELIPIKNILGIEVFDNIKTR